MNKIFLVVCFFVFSVNLNSQVKPILHFTFDNAKEGINSKESIFIGDSIIIKKGVINNALYFDGHSYLKLPDNISKLLNDFTISTWINIDEQRVNQPTLTIASGTSEYLKLTPQRGEKENGVSLVMTNENKITDNHTDREERISNTQQKEPLSNNVWHHIAFSLRGTVGRLYVDGEIVEIKDNFTTKPSIFNNTIDNYIGKPIWPDQFFKRLIDDFRIYNIALSYNDILDIVSMGNAFIIKEDSINLHLHFIDDVTSSHINLPTKGVSGSNIEWHSMNEGIIENDGIIHRPTFGYGDIEVKLIASISNGNCKINKEFDVLKRDYRILLSDPLIGKYDNIYSFQIY